MSETPGTEEEADERTRLPAPGLTRASADEWALVLLSQGIEVRVQRDESGFVLEVTASQRRAAEAAIAAYRAENPEPPDAADEAGWAGREPNWAGAWVGLAIVGFHLWIGNHDGGAALVSRGSAQAARIVEGEWWRCFTALCLHADWGHAIANAGASLYFMGAVGRLLGTGPGLALILLAGAGGNALNALTSSQFHDSLGASTSIFGAVGLLAGLAVARRHRQRLGLRRVWLPVGAGLALLAMLGTGGVRVDLWAHFYGLAVGGILGLLASDWARQPLPERQQWRLGLTAGLALLFCWSLALR